MSSYELSREFRRVRDYEFLHGKATSIAGAADTVNDSLLSDLKRTHA